MRSAMDWTRFWCGMLALATLSFLFSASSLQARRDGKEIDTDKSILSEGRRCAEGGCHDDASGSTFNRFGSVDFLDLPESYQAGQAYNLALQIEGPPSVRVYGFQLAARFEDGASAGSLIPLASGVQSHQIEGVGVLLHSPIPLDSGDVPFRWVAPQQPLGDVIFEVAANAANDNLDPSFDHISTNRAVVAGPQAPVETVDSFFAQVADGIIGNIGFQTTVILANRGEGTTVELDFFNSSGTPMTLELGALGPATSFQIPLAAGASFSGQTPGSGEFQFGYARVRAPQGVGGTAVFTRSEADTGLVLFETGVPASRPQSSFSLFSDQVGNRQTGLALVNPNPDTASVTLRLFDKQAVEQANSPTQIELLPDNHLAQFVDELFPGLADGFQGTLSVESDQPLAAVTLRQDVDFSQPFPQKVPLLTAFPVIADPVESVEAGSFTTLPSGGIQLQMDLPREAVGVVVRYFQDERLVGFETHPSSGGELAVASERKGVTRVLVQPILKDGSMGKVYLLGKK